MIRCVLAGLCVFLLAACGGSDDGGNDSAASGNDASDARIEQLALYPIGFGAAQSTLLLARVASDALVASAANRFENLSQDCPSGGRREVRYDDADSSASITVNDGLRLSYVNCANPAFEGTINGGLDETIRSIDRPAANASREVVYHATVNDFRVSETAGDVQVSGVFDVIYRRNGSTADTVDVRGAGDGLHFSLVDGARVDIDASSRLTKYSDFDADRYRFGFEAQTTLTSDGRQLTLDFDSLRNVAADDGEFHGRFGDLPTRGVARFDAPALGSQCVLARDSDDRGVAAKNTPAIRFATDRDCLDNGDHTDTVTWNVALNGPAAAGRDDSPTLTLFRDNDTFGLRAAR